LLDFPEPLTQAAATGQPRNSESQSPMSLEAATHHTQMNYCQNIRVDITDDHYSGRAKYCDAHVCVSVCLFLSASISPELHARSSPIFCACHLRPWLGTSLLALRYVMYFRFYGRRHVCACQELATRQRRLLKPTHRGATPDRRAKSDIYDRFVTIFYAKTATTL